MNLQQKAKKILGNERGVTLIELLAVIIILGIIAAIGVPAIMNQMNSAKKNTDLQNAQIITDAVNRMIANNPGATIGGTLPAAIDTATISGGGITSESVSSALIDKNINGGPYLTSLPSIQDTTDYTSFNINDKGNVAPTK